MRRAREYDAAPAVTGMRAGALRQWDSARSRFKRTVGVRTDAGCVQFSAPGLRRLPSRRAR
jgi:hypothetical protein